MIYMAYPLLILLLFYGAVVCKQGEWNEEYLSLKQTKAFLGFCAVIIMFHHISQKTCEPSLDQRWFRPGLEFFIYVGYLCVAMFFFCSGYGMYTSFRKGRRDTSFGRYFLRRIPPVIIPAVIMWLVFFFIEKMRGMIIEPPVLINVFDYIWYVPALLFVYLIFYPCFYIIKDEKLSFIFLWLGILLYFILCAFFSPGTWWYNTQFMFAVGAMVGANVSGFTEFSRRNYIPCIVVSFILTLTGYILAGYYGEIVTYLGISYNEAVYGYIKITAQLISSLFFVWLMLLIGMKIRIGNRILDFLGGFTLELYLVHPLFVHLFAFAFVQNASGPVFYIENQVIYILAVIMPSLPIAYVIHKGVYKITKRGKK